ncbi:hypothetical protein SAMN04487957_10573 [Halomonas shengliensis]|uniref:Uncharacterized protein n=1 Tax=Halomonas shengliensis TaxID=419597 RepID=A0A1H0ID36_9GAMM|nr:hypothetical protein [Halomonas shengliensis]SDO29308.1 hypothetical protein SAMN04487957_10573 [Halomonas shengliensis]
MDYQRLNLRDHRAMAREDHPGHTPEAASTLVARLLDMEVERRTLYGDERLQGYHNVSPTAGIGEQPGGTDKAREPLASLYDRGLAEHLAHQEARRIIEAAGLTFRERVAVLIRAAKTDRRSNGPRGMSYAQIVANPRPWVQYLGWPPGAGAMLFKDVKAFDNAASEARRKLMKWVMAPSNTTCCRNQEAELSSV